MSTSWLMMQLDMQFAVQHPTLDPRLTTKCYEQCGTGPVLSFSLRPPSLFPCSLSSASPFPSLAIETN